MHGGQRCRDVVLFELSGQIELALSSSGHGARSTPQRVSHAIAAAVAEIGGQPVTPVIAAELCVADRQFLMHRIAERLGQAQRWITSQCLSCRSPFDFSIDVTHLPVREAGSGFPVFQVQTSHGALTLRVPCGADQEVATRHPNADSRWLLKRCVCEGQPTVIDALDDEECRKIEEQLSEVSPAVVTKLQASCPSCSAEQSVDLDPYYVLSRSADAVLDDVHRLAWSYHWSQAEILSLPTDRRRFYLERIDRARGFVS